MATTQRITQGQPSRKGLIRALNRKGVRDEKSLPVQRKIPTSHEPTICARCGAVYLRKKWRHNYSLTDEQMERGEWGFCPACIQVSRQEGQGRLIIRGDGVAANRGAIRRRIENVAARAALMQPERRIVSNEETPEGMDLITTSQKLAHRLAHELKKAFGGKVAYTWSDDGTLLATWDCQRRRQIRKK
jgi:NMD protein affecting ribosome stability and mRNA decay